MRHDVKASLELGERLRAGAGFIDDLLDAWFGNALALSCTGRGWTSLSKRSRLLSPPHVNVSN
jgi:hypothetical protein